MDWFVVGIILLSSACDALRDAWYGEVGYWRFHTVKWLAFIPPLAVLLFFHIPTIMWIPVVIASWIAWRLSLRFIGGKKWPSVWEKLWKRIK